jgi:hypothetical protein
VRLKLYGRDNAQNVLTTDSQRVCSKTPTTVTLELDPHADLDHVRIRLLVDPDGGSGQWSPSEYRELG